MGLIEVNLNRQGLRMELEMEDEQLRENLMLLVNNKFQVNGKEQVESPIKGRITLKFKHNLLCIDMEPA